MPRGPDLPTKAIRVFNNPDELYLQYLDAGSIEKLARRLGIDKQIINLRMKEYFGENYFRKARKVRKRYNY